ncbi:DUF1048 domain-containing protein [Kineococcus sp. NPDC059986]|uniref:DUF1048 domain-containing protein n=1 Tax=Kineococcus sp. NPDC059986 TaxID=3155538 RepID=UPI00344D16C1
MTKNPLEVLTGALEDKKRYRAYKERAKNLPEEHRAVLAAVERYVLHCPSTPTDGGRAASLFEDLADLFEQAAADGTPVRSVVGEDPVEFVETFVATYSDGGWITAERRRLRESVDRVVAGDGR